MDNVKITVKKKNIRHLYIRVVSSSEILITCGENYSAQEIDRFMRQKQDWIKHHLQTRKETEELGQRSLTDGSRIILAEKIYMLKLNSADKNAVTQDGTTVYMAVCDTKDEDTKQKLLLKWYKRAFYIYAKARMDDILLNNAHLKISFPSKLSIKDTSSRWGSYSSKTKTLSLCIRLGAYAKEAIDSVICHELAHTGHMDHQKGFYQLLYKMMPSYQHAHKLLKEKKPNQYWYLV